MARNLTKNLKLILPKQEEHYNVDDFNDNFKKLDEGTVPLFNANNIRAVRWHVFTNNSIRRELFIESGSTHSFNPTANTQYRIEITASGTGIMRVRGNRNQVVEPTDDPNHYTEISLSNTPKTAIRSWTQAINGGAVVISANYTAVINITKVVIYNDQTNNKVWELDLTKLSDNGIQSDNNGVRALGSDEYRPGVRRVSNSDNDNSMVMLQTADLDLITKTGFYEIKNSELGAANGPLSIPVYGNASVLETNVAVLQVMQVSVARVMQVLHHNSQGQWQRAFQAGNWTTWERLITQTSNGTSTSHNHSASDISSGTLAIARIPVGSSSSTVCSGSDSRLSDSRTPTSHSHQWSEIVSPPALATANLTTVTQSEAETGTSTTVRGWTPQRVRQAAQASPRYRASGTVTDLFNGSANAGENIIMSQSIENFDFLDVRFTFIDTNYGKSSLVPVGTFMQSASGWCLLAHHGTSGQYEIMIGRQNNTTLRIYVLNHGGSSVNLLNARIRGIKSI